MLNNNQFLKIIKKSFKSYLAINTSRSTAKLKILHGYIANDLKETLGENYSIQSQGYENDKEGHIDGRYYPKKVDITIKYNGKPIAGYAIKFVMRNYSQNSNNYFENMLGETANIRSNRIPYFQVFIIFDKVPYFKKHGEFSRYDEISEHNLNKYLKLSSDDPCVFYHTPDITLIVLIKLKERTTNHIFRNDEDYASYYLSVINDDNLLSYSTRIDDIFGKNVILNDYKNFIERSCYTIKGQVKK